MGSLWTYTLQLPRDARAVRVARLTLRTVLTTHGLGELLDPTELLTSELLTNAYRHSDGPSSLRVRNMANRLRVGVWDTNPTIPPPFANGTLHSPEPESEQGRGLMLVRRWADNYGGYEIGGELDGKPGKLLWFEVLRRDAFGMAA
ncbi:ATP-binding protein [Streptantibioticus rubrisoli]|uniref:ATP-binding protein n=1 Tax=Streptantibioticus rubrisoli TaxID=1387313 RepID=A0ABT1PKT9_9ACTN|nr:ATP-binding protein [Streptantibioticus rubrisoli]MCQ4045984.1 ATP-binding protein [Streptantibioticus rubrisoli]